MPEENENVEDFISLWRKKMVSEMKTPSVIGETLDKVEVLEKENERLRNQIRENIELISKSENIIKSIIEEKNSLVEEKNLAVIQAEQKLKAFEGLLLEKDQEILSKDTNITELKDQINSAISQQKENVLEASKEGFDSNLIAELQSELVIKKNQLIELNQDLNKHISKIEELTQKNELLSQQVNEMTKSPPVQSDSLEESQEPVSSKPSLPLESLCQDLQSELNKYKRLFENLKNENTKLKLMSEGKEVQTEVADLEDIKSENEKLKQELSRLQNLYDNTIKEKPISEEIKSNEIKVLKEELEEKSKLIEELKVQKQTQEIVSGGPMTGLIEDLQGKINKFKVALNEKNKIINELKNKINE